MWYVTRKKDNSRFFVAKEDVLNAMKMNNDDDYDHLSLRSAKTGIVLRVPIDQVKNVVQQFEESQKLILENKKSEGEKNINKAWLGTKTKILGLGGTLLAVLIAACMHYHNIATTDLLGIIKAMYGSYFT
jgi:hypothetical protein